MTVYAVANVENKPARIEIQILPAGTAAAATFDVVRIDPDEQAILANEVVPGTWLPLTLAPEELICLRVRSVARSRPASQAE